MIGSEPCINEVREVTLEVDLFPHTYQFGTLLPEMMYDVPT